MDETYFSDINRAVVIMKLKKSNQLQDIPQDRVDL